MSDDVVTSSDVTDVEKTPANVPSSFAALKRPELLAAADYFGTTTEGNVKAIRADLEDNGVTWAQYANAFHLPGASELVDPEPEVSEPEVKEKEEEAPVTREILTKAPNEKLEVAADYLVRFVGDNEYFEFKDYRFTKANPFAVMPAEDAQEALELEQPPTPPKFRQAYPKELSEYFS